MAVLWFKHVSGYASSVIIEHVTNSTFQDESVDILSGVEPKFESIIREILS